MYTTDVGFTPQKDVLDVTPPIRMGVRNSVWVKTPSDDKEEIKEAARNKMMTCYGIEISDITVFDGNQFIS